MNERRRHRPDSVPAYRRWTSDDDALLIGLYAKGKSLSDLAARLGFSEPAISKHMERLELPKQARGRPKGRCNGAIAPDAEPVE
jgi:predicted ArsR family transcriptional regulator